MNDVAVSAWFHAHTHPVLTQVLLVITHVHGTLGICILASGIAIWLLATNRPWWVLTLILCVPGGLILNAAVKQVFQRARPYFDDPILTLTTYSLPSGHTAGATVFYGFLTVFLLAHVPQRRWRFAIVATACGMVALVALSRVYLGVHYLGDVLVAIVEGVLWLALCFAAVRALRRQSGVKRVKA